MSEIKQIPLIPLHLNDLCIGHTKLIWMKFCSSGFRQSSSHHTENAYIADYTVYGFNVSTASHGPIPNTLFVKSSSFFQIVIVFYSYVKHSIKNQYQLYTDLNNDKAVCKGILTPLFTQLEKCLPNKYLLNTC